MNLTLKKGQFVRHTDPTVNDGMPMQILDVNFRDKLVMVNHYDRHKDKYIDEWLSFEYLEIV